MLYQKYSGRQPRSVAYSRAHTANALRRKPDGSNDSAGPVRKDIADLLQHFSVRAS